MSEAPHPLRDSALARLAGVTHGFFTRRGGVSGGIYDSLNCGFGSDDDPDSVRANRARAVAALGHAPRDIATAFQVHGDHVVDVETAWAPRAGPKADGMVTTVRGVPIGIMTADCAPVLFADAEAGVIGAAHAGWHGAIAGVVASTVGRMVARGAKRGRILAAVGPCIGPASYEVGSEFPEPFLAEDAENRRFFRPAARAGHHLFDLGAFVKETLDTLGLASTAIIERDTCAEADHFFSYRRTCHGGGTDYGRNLSMIMLEE